MKRATHLVLLLTVCSAFLVPRGLGHTPLEKPGEHGSIETAYRVPDPTKSWTLYEELHDAGEAHYYAMVIGEGESLRVSLFTPVGEDAGFLPLLVVMGPDLSDAEAVPEGVEVPDGYGAVVVRSFRATRPEYEPFTPTSYFFLAEFSHAPADAYRYYVAVLEPGGAGRYGLAVGYVEEFTALEWLRIPVDLYEIHLWEGQSPLLVFGPLLAAVAAGLWYIYGREVVKGAPMWLGLGAGLLYVGTGVNTFAQMALALAASGFSSGSLLTLVFVSLQLGLGYLVLLKTLRDRRRDVKNRLVLAGYGALGLFVWAGSLVGPALLLVSAAYPDR